MTPLTTAWVDFQTNVTTTGRDLDSNTLRALETVTFPLSSPFRMNDVPDYGGFKILKMGQNLCISRFFNAGKLDEYKRPIPSAKSVLFESDILFRENLDLLFVFDNLAGDEPLTAEDFFKNWQHASKQFDKPNLIKRFQATGLPSTDVLKAMTTLLGKNQLRILGKDRDATVALFCLLATVCPPSIFEQTTWCTAQYDEHSQTEEVICTTWPAPEPKKSGFAALLEKFSRKDNRPPSIDVDNARTIGMVDFSKSSYFRLYMELLTGELWESIPFLEKLHIIVQLADQTHKGANVNLESVISSLQKDALSEGYETIIRP